MTRATLSFPFRRLLAAGGLAIALGGIGLVHAAEPAAPKAKPDPTYGSDQTLVYKQVGERSLHLYVFKPADWSAKDRHPCVVYIHGGGWTQGNPGMAKPTVDALRKHGFVIVSVEYRLTSRDPQEADPAPCIEDAKSAMRYVRGHATDLGIDPARVAAAGASAGGHLSAACAFLTSFDAPTDDLKVSCRPDAMALAVPVLDNGPDGYKGGVPKISANMKAYSPAHNVTKGAPPTVIFAGREDNTAKLVLIEKFQSRMRELGNDCELHVYPGPHGFQREAPALDAVNAETVKFFRRIGWIAAEPVASPRAEAPAKIQ